jgi:multiple sugar transport system permease protein
VESIVWLAAVIALYGAVVATIVAGGVAIRLRHAAGIGLTAAGIAAGIAAGCLIGWSGGLPLLLGSLIALGMSAGTYAVMRPAMTWQAGKTAKELRRQSILHLALLTGSAVFLVPFAWLVVTSLKEEDEMSKFPPVWIPRQQVRVHLDGREVGLATAQYQGRDVKVAVVHEDEDGTRHLQILEPKPLAGTKFNLPSSQVTPIKHFAQKWKNYRDAVFFLPEETRHGLVFLTNTLLLSGLSILGTLLSSSMVAFSFARLRWPGRDVLFVILIATMMVPAAVTMMPVFLIFRAVGWIDTLRPLWVPTFFGSAFNIFLLRQFFLTIPNDLEEAARIDGCSYWGIYWRIMLPLIKPALAAITIMTFMGAWNNFMGPLIYVSTPTRMPLAYALSLFQTQHTNEPGMLMAAATMMMLPVLALFFFTQRYFIQGITLTGIKG